MSDASHDVSVLIPVVERPEPLAALYDEFSTPLHAAGFDCEFIFAVQPSYAGLIPPLKTLVSQGAPIRVIEFGHGVSETAMLKVAAANASGRLLVTLPAYRQVEAGAVPALVRQVEEGADLAVARRWPRRDSLINRLQSRALHIALGSLARGRLHDVACGVRAMRPKVLDETRVYGDFFRFLPLLAQREGFVVEEVASPVHPAAMRGRMYGAGTYLRRLLDVFGLTFLLRFTDKPLRFFGLIGSVLGIVGGLMLIAILLERQFANRGLANRPILLLGVLLVTLGIQAIALGLIGEMIVHLHASRRPLYRLRERRRRPRFEANDTVGAPPVVEPATSEAAVIERELDIATSRHRDAG
ncbi:MAG TPA: hypothetical protein VFL95_12300 [Gemmatimonadales bacterium]|nr:hypothetical protein [Gemmatimonadales bacterium]